MWQKCERLSENFTLSQFIYTNTSHLSRFIDFTNHSNIHNFLSFPSKKKELDGFIYLALSLIVKFCVFLKCLFSSCFVLSDFVVCRVFSSPFDRLLRHSFDTCRLIVFTALVTPKFDRRLWQRRETSASTSLLRLNQSGVRAILSSCSLRLRRVIPRFFRCDPLLMLVRMIMARNVPSWKC